MKNIYTIPQMETTEYTKEDLIVTSTGTGSNNIGDLGVSEDKNSNFGELHG